MTWYLGIFAWQRVSGRKLIVRRQAYWVPDPNDDGEFVERAEVIDHAWQIILRDDIPETFSMENDAGRLAVGHGRQANGFPGPYLRPLSGGGWQRQNQREKRPIEGIRALPDRFEE